MGDAGLFQELVWRGMVHQVTDPELATVLAEGPTTAYHGIDATADSLHVGHLVGLVTLQRLQQAGHRPIALLGGGTSLIGDPSFKAEERPLLGVGEIEANTRGIRAQVERLLDTGSGPAGGTGALVVDNAEWLARFPLTDFLRDVGKHFRVNALLTRDAVRSRLVEREQGLSFTEFSYALLQAYDFLHLFDTEGCRLQLGGSDQWSNITGGIDLVRRTRGQRVFGVTWPLMTKDDGMKFGKTESGAVWLDPARTTPYAFFQFWLRTDDADVVRHLRALTFLERRRIDELEEELQRSPENRVAQRVLARELTTAVHGSAECERAERAARSLYEGDLRSLDERDLLAALAEAPSSDVSRDTLASVGVSLVELLAETGLVASRSAARTAIGQGAVSVNGTREDDVDRRLGPADLLAGAYLVLRRGKREYHLVRTR